MKKNLKIEQVHDLPGNLDAESIYVLLPKNFSQDFYNERTDRNIGWITKEEQELEKLLSKNPHNQEIRHPEGGS